MALRNDDSLFDWTGIVTCDAAERFSPYDLAGRWADRLSWPLASRTANDELAELACKSALARWLTRWQPIVIHRAILAGASPEKVAAALGNVPQRACGVWHEWASPTARAQHRRPPRRLDRGVRDGRGDLHRRPIPLPDIGSGR